MPRVKKSVKSRRRRKGVLAEAKGFRGSRGRLYRIAKVLDVPVTFFFSEFKTRRNAEREQPVPVEFDFLQAMGGLRGRSSLRCGGCTLSCTRFRVSRRQPTFQIPAAFGIANENQAGAGQGHGPKLKMPAQQSPPAQTGGHAVGAEEIFMAEGGILTDGHAIQGQFWKRENREGKVAHLHGPAECVFQPSGKISAHAV